MRTDPTDTGGLFVGRRPGTAPVRYAGTPERRGGRRERIDGLIAHGLLACMVFINLLFWGPMPAASLWLGSQVEYLTGSVSLGILVAFASMLAVLFGALVLLKRIDHVWVLARRAAGHDQRQGSLPRIFAITAAIGAIAFSIWLFLFSGASLAPLGLQF